MRFRRKSAEGTPQPLAATSGERFGLDGPVFDAAVEVGVGAFLEGESPPADEAILASLEQAGVDDWLAVRLLIFLPLAFGRLLLPGAQLSDRFMDGNSERRLADDPVFVWASQRAARAIRHEAEWIGLRSSEVNAANKLLHAGDRMEDLRFTTVMMSKISRFSALRAIISGLICTFAESLSWLSFTLCSSSFLSYSCLTAFL